MAKITNGAETIPTPHFQYFFIKVCVLLYSFCKVSKFFSKKRTVSGRNVLYLCYLPFSMGAISLHRLSLGSGEMTEIGSLDTGCMNSTL